MEKHDLEYIDQVVEFMELNEFMHDEDLAWALDQVVKLITREVIPAGAAPQILVKLQAISSKCAILAAHYSTIAKDRAGTPNNHKKNIYYSTKEALDKLCDSLKYLARQAI
jgi:hypothetical protein